MDKTLLEANAEEISDMQAHCVLASLQCEHVGDMLYDREAAEDFISRISFGHMTLTDEMWDAITFMPRGAVEVEPRSLYGQPVDNENYDPDDPFPPDPGPVTLDRTRRFAGGEATTDEAMFVKEHVRELDSGFREIKGIWCTIFRQTDTAFDAAVKDPVGRERMLALGEGAALGDRISAWLHQDVPLDDLFYGEDVDFCDLPFSDVHAGDNDDSDEA